MPGYAVDPTELFAAQARLTDAAGAGRNELGQVRDASDDLLGYGWAGHAAAAFRSGFDEWLGAANQMLAGLDELADAIGLAGRDYERAESTNNGTFQAMAS